MNLFSENVIPGNHGKVFSTNAKTDNDLKAIQRLVSAIPGVAEVKINPEAFPMEFTVITDRLVNIADVEKEAARTGFHAIPKGLFEL